MKRRLFLPSAPVHPVCHVAGGRLLVPARRCPRAGERRIPPRSDAIRNGHSRRLPALADPDGGARPARPWARTFPKGQRRPGVRRRTKRRSPHAPAAPVRRASGGGPPPSPSLLAGPCRIPSASSRDDRLTAFPHMTPSGNRAKDTPTLGPCRARAAKRTESSVLPASGHPETRARRTCSPKTGEVSPFVPAPAGGNHGSSQEAVV